jgi:sugar lactone lactonase YvrE
MTYWDISTAFYSGKSLFIGPIYPTGNSIRFKPDGLIMYLVHTIDTTIYQYILSIAWDITTAVYSGKYFDVGKQDGEPQDISFNPDGSIMYMLGNDNDTVFRYDLNGKKHSPWDISSSVYNRIKLDISYPNIYPWGLFFSSDGTKFYTLCTDENTIHQFNLSVPWDITSGLYSGKSFYIGDQDLEPSNIAFSSDGKNFYTSNISTATVYQYTLSIPWDLSTAFYSNKYLYTGDQDNFAFGIFFSIIGSEMYILGTSTDTVYQYTLPETPPPPPKKEASRTGIYSFKTLS